MLGNRMIYTNGKRKVSNCNIIPFNKIPSIMVVEMVCRAVFWVNTFPHPNRVSNTMSPRTLVTGRTVDHNKHCKYEFGQYVQVHDQHNNSMQPHTTGAIALCPTRNTQGNYYFMSLTSGRKLNRVHATPLPMLEDFISRVHMLAR